MNVSYRMASKNTYSYLHNYLHLLVKTKNTDLYLQMGQNSSEYEEGIPYITGNTLWAIYQFTVVIVLLSILRARMVNTYHRIFKEADVQWKFFRYVYKFIFHKKKERFNLLNINGTTRGK